MFGEDPPPSESAPDWLAGLKTYISLVVVISSMVRMWNTAFPYQCGFGFGIFFFGCLLYPTGVTVILLGRYPIGVNGSGRYGII